MIAIVFSPKYEDRVSIFLRNAKIRELGIEYSCEEAPEVGNERNCYLLFKPLHNRHINVLLSHFSEMKAIMGVDDLVFFYCYSMKEYYTQRNDQGYSIPWFRI